MAASVRLDHQVRTDVRITLFANELGISRREAVGALYELWYHCTETGGHKVGQNVVEAILGYENCVAALLSSGLAEQHDEQIYVKGTTGRIEWLQKRRAAAVKGGAATKAKSKQKRTTRTLKQSEGQTGATRPTLGPDSGKAKRGPNEGPTSTVTVTSTELTSGVSDSLPGESRLSAAKRKLLDRFRPDAIALWQLQEKLRGEANPGCRGLGMTAERLVLLCERLDSGASVSECEHVLAVYAAEARLSGTVKHFNGTTPWRPENFTRALGQDIKDIAKQPERNSELRYKFVTANDFANSKGGKVDL